MNNSKNPETGNPIQSGDPNSLAHSLAQLRKQAKDLVKSFRSGETNVIERIRTHHPAHSNSTMDSLQKFSLRDAQLVIARENGFENWTALKYAAFDNRATLKKGGNYVWVMELCDAVTKSDLGRAQTILNEKPWLANFQPQGSTVMAIHLAVKNRHPELVRLLLENGADEHAKILEDNNATSAINMAQDREFDDVVSVIEKHAAQRTGPTDRELMQQLLDGEPTSDMTRQMLDDAVWKASTPLEQAILDGNAEEFSAQVDSIPVAKRKEVLQKHLNWIVHLAVTNTAGLTEAKTLEALQEGKRANESESHLIMLRQILGEGVDPDDPQKVQWEEQEVVLAGNGLRLATSYSAIQTVRLLLEHGANPNLTSGDGRRSSMGSALHRCDQEVIRLLIGHGGAVTPQQMARYGLADDFEKVSALATQSELSELLDSAINGAQTEIAAICLKRMQKPVGLWQLEKAIHPWRKEKSRSNEVFDLFEQLLKHGVENLNGDKTTDKAGLPYKIGISYLLIHELARLPNEKDAVRFASLLLNYGQQLDVLDKHLESTPLGWAARWGRADLVSLFLKHGCDPNLSGAEWAQPVRWAHMKGHTRIVEMLT